MAWAFKGGKFVKEDDAPPAKAEKPDGTVRCLLCGAQVVWERVDGALVAYGAHISLDKAIRRRHLRGLGLSLAEVAGVRHAKKCKRRLGADGPFEPIPDRWGLAAGPRPATVNEEGEPVDIRDLLLVVLDTETTGIDVENDRICELGLVYFTGGQQVGEPINIRIKPGIEIPDAASAIHGITNEAVADCPSFAEVAPELARHLDGSYASEVMGLFVTEPPLLVGYNAARFDFPLVDAELVRAGLEPLCAGRRYVDPITWSTWEGRADSSKLSELCARVGVPLDSAHAAWADAQATGALLAKLIEYELIPDDLRLALEQQAWMLERIDAEREAWGHYFYRCRMKPEVIRVGFGKHRGFPASDIPARYWSFLMGKWTDIHPGALGLMRILATNKHRGVAAAKKEQQK